MSLCVAGATFSPPNNQDFRLLLLPLYASSSYSFPPYLPNSNSSSFSSFSHPIPILAPPPLSIFFSSSLLFSFCCSSPPLFVPSLYSSFSTSYAFFLPLSSTDPLLLFPIFIPLLFSIHLLLLLFLFPFLFILLLLLLLLLFVPFLIFLLLLLFILQPLLFLFLHRPIGKLHIACAAAEPESRRFLWSSAEGSPAFAGAIAFLKTQ